MRVIIITRLFSGLKGSFERSEWKPYGVPAIYKMIEEFNRRKLSLNVLFLCKTEVEELNIKRIMKYSFIELPFVKFTILPYYSLRFNSCKLKQIYNDIIQYILVLKLFRIRQYDLAYFDRSNIVLAAIFSFLGVKTVLRFLGIAGFQRFTDKITSIIWSPLVYLSLKAPFSLVISTEDGSPKSFFDNCLGKKTPCKILLNGVENNKSLLKDLRYSIRKKYKFTENYPILLFVGRLTEDKGAKEFFDTLIRLKNQTAEFYVICICGGSDYSIFSKKMSEAGMIHKVVFERFVEHQNISLYYDQSDIYISLNKLGNLSNTVLEAMQAGKCVIALGKDREKCTDESTEKLVPNDVVVRIDRKNIVNDLTEKLADLINNPDKISVYSERMKGFAKDFLWSWDERVNYEMELLEMVAKGKTIKRSIFQNIHNERKDCV